MLSIWEHLLLSIKILALLVTLSSFAQKTDSYYYEGGKKELEIDRTQVGLYVTNDFNPSSIENLDVKIESFQPNEINKNEKWAKVIFNNNISEIDYLKKVNALKKLA